MRAIICHEPGDESVLELAELPTPEPGPHEVRIRVAGAGLNRADLLQRRGLYPPPPGASELLGLEVAGTVSAVGRHVTRWREGDRVMALLPGGGYAEEAVAHEGSVMAVSEGLDPVHAAAVPEAFLTAHLNLLMLGRGTAGETALVHGGSGGVGTAAIQLLQHQQLATVVTAGSDDRCRRCLELGADRAVNYHTADFTAAARELSGDRGVDLILDCIGGAYLPRHLELLAPDGRLLLIGLMGGARTEIDLRPVLGKRLQLIGSTLRSRSAQGKARLVDSFREHFDLAFAAGRLQPVVDRVLPLAEAAEAHRLLAAGEIFGKLVLAP